MAKNASKNYTEEQSKELNELDKLYSSIKIATDDNSQVTVSIDDLKKIINEEIRKSGTTSVPSGTIISHMGTKAPGGYLNCDGTIYNITDYPELSKHIKNDFGKSNFFGGDGETTFAVPDLRGEFLRGTGNNSHSDQGNGADVGTHQNATFLPGSIGGGNGSSTSYIFSTGTWAVSDNWDKGVAENVGGSVPTTSKNTTGRISGGTVRPTNTSVLYCIKY